LLGTISPISLSHASKSLKVGRNSCPITSKKRLKNSQAYSNGEKYLSGTWFQSHACSTPMFLSGMDLVEADFL